jgi:hypothetical protein
VWGRWGRCVGWPPDWGGLEGGPGPLRGQRRVEFGVGNAWSLFPRDDRRALRSVVLMALTRGLIFVPGLESSVRSAQLIRRWGLPRESAPWSGTGDGEVLMGRCFWVGCGCFFLWGGTGGEEETPGHGLLSRFFAGRRESPNSPFFMLYIIY